jgi:hypothetical protein
MGFRRPPQGDRHTRSLPTGEEGRVALARYSAAEAACDPCQAC